MTIRTYIESAKEHINHLLVLLREKSQHLVPQSHDPETEFFPAALEIQETPPSPIGRTIAWAIMLFFIIAVIWAIIGKVDIVATAQGKIIPSGRVKVIQPLEIGVIRGIQVTEGQQVNKGDVLIELDPTSTEADKERLSKEFATAQQEHLRLQILGHIIQQQKQSSRSSLKDPIQREILDNQISEYTNRLAALDSQIKRRQAELVSTQQLVKKLEGTLPLISKRVKSLKSLSGKKLVAEHAYLELEEERIVQQQDLAAQRSRLTEIKAGIDEARQQREAVIAEYRSKTLSDLAESERKLSAVEQELIKAEQRTTLQKLTAPVDGVVQQLAVHTVGGVVTPAQQLMLIVPQEQNLEVEAFVANKDIGFVRNGQTAEIKVETFPFTRYGTIDAEILNVSNDAISDENLGLVYAARVLMKKSVMQVGDKLVNLTPGMAVTVEVKTGKRRLIEFFLSPLLRYKDESIKER